MKLLLLILFFCSCTNEQLPIYYKPIEVVYTSYQKDVLTELNNIRVTNGSKKLKAEIVLTQLATDHAFSMDSLSVLSHDNFWNRYLQSKSIMFAEIVSKEFITPQSQINGFASSQSHFEVMRNHIYTHCGIYKQGEFLCIDLASYKK